MKEGIAKVIGEVQPDHLNNGNAIRSIAVVSGNAGIMHHYGAKPCELKAVAYYMTAHPNKFVKTTGYLDKQMRAVFACHRTRFPEENSPSDTIRLYLNLRSIDFGIRSLKGRAEGFRIPGTVHMHCLPEAGR
ncbi:MAG: hypothetical protein ACI32N_00475 [Bulleidia sp.]